MILLYAFWGVHLTCWFPCIVTFRVSFPFDKVLECLRLPMTSVVDYLLHHIFFFSSDEVRWWPRIVRSVLIGFVIG